MLTIGVVSPPSPPFIDTSPISLVLIVAFSTIIAHTAPGPHLFCISLKNHLGEPIIFHACDEFKPEDLFLSGVVYSILRNFHYSLNYVIYLSVQSCFPADTLCKSISVFISFPLDFALVFQNSAPHVCVTFHVLLHSTPLLLHSTPLAVLVTTFIKPVIYLFRTLPIFIDYHT